MDSQPIRITVPGIKRALKSYKLERSICEYIWNGYDAGASVVELDFKTDPLETVTEIRIKDNGSGINFGTLDQTFRPFFQSNRELQNAVQKKISAVHGKNGVGRLTFFSFARRAKWETVYLDDNGQHHNYCITIDQDSLNTFQSTDPQSTDKLSGTQVRFTGVYSLNQYQFETTILDYIIKQFAWFLELNRAREFKLLINGQSLDCNGLVGDSDEIIHQIPSANKEFDFAIKYIRWTERLRDEYSHYYYIGSDNVEREKETTTLNNKGDNFYHSVYITSDYFDTIDVFDFINSTNDNGQISLFNRGDYVYKKLREYVDNFLRKKRKPFLKKYTDTLIQKYEDDGVFPKYENNQWEIYRHQDLEEVVRGLYQVEPRLFSDLNLEQKKTFVRLLNLALDEGERDHLFNILREIINLDPSELQELSQLLKHSRLSNIIKTIKLIEDRFKAVSQLEKLVYDPEIYVNEPDHIQKMIEGHYWLFGEEYHLVAAAERKFEKALRRHIYILRGENKKVTINHKDKKKEMDIFAVRRLMKTNKINNIVIELKNPKVNLGAKQLSQVKDYMDVIRNEPKFNGSNMSWQFYLVGNRFNSYIEGEIENSINHGEASLVYSRDRKRFRIYVKTWSEIFTEFELRHNFLLEKLKLRRDKLIDHPNNADDIIEDQASNTATRPPELDIPKP